MKLRFDVTGMFCAACAANVERAVKKIKGVSEVSVNLIYGMLTVVCDESVTSQTVIDAVKQAGYGCKAQINEKLVKQKQRRDAMRAETNAMRNRFVLSFVMLFPLMYVAMARDIGVPILWWLDMRDYPFVNGLVQTLLLVPVIIINRIYFTDGIRKLFRLRPNMYSLISVGCIASIALSLYMLVLTALNKTPHMYYFDSAAMILTLVSLGKYFETRAKKRTGDSIEKLIDLEPELSVVLINGKETEIPTSKVRVGDIVIVKAGQTVPVDGIVEQGEAELNCSSLTGESVPVPVEKASKVKASSICGNGYIHVRATGVGDDTALAGIVRLVEDASATKAPIARMADKISLYFVPAVMGIALLTLIIWIFAGRNVENAVIKAVSVLVISCPCALGLATPLAIMVGVGASATKGILIKSASALETASSVNTVIFDKTGTLTTGKLRFADYASDDKERLLRFASCAESGSTHPAAVAVINEASANGIEAETPDEFVNLPGRGVYAKKDGNEIIVGNKKLLAQFNVDITPWESRYNALSSHGGLVLYVACNGEILGIMNLSDELREESRRACDALKAMNIKPIMLSGDSKENGTRIADALGIDAVCDVLPEDKDKTVRELQQKGKTVAMVGDGINDAPALSRSDVGIAIGAGTDIAALSADVILMSDNPMDAVRCIGISGKCMKTIRMNLFWALGYNCIGIPVAAGALAFAGITLTPALAAAAMCLSSISVATNSLLLKRRILKNQS